VISTEVGYSQGKMEEPSYEQVCSGSTGHAEVVQVTYDPQQVRAGLVLGFCLGLTVAFKEDDGCAWGIAAIRGSSAFKLAA
jgi:hypothetical protein